MVMANRAPGGNPFDKIFLKKREIEEIRERKLKVPVSISGWPIHTYYAKRILVLLPFTVVICGIVAIVGIANDIKGPALALYVAAFGGAFLLFAIYFAIKETILRASLRRRGEIEDEMFWETTLSRRGLL